VCVSSLQEVKYRSPSETGDVLRPSKTSVYQEHQVSYMDDNVGLHAMGNATVDDTAVSLHVYSPPYQICSAFEPSGHKRTVSLAAANATYPVQAEAAAAAAKATAATPAALVNIPHSPPGADPNSVEMVRD
jgi:hypothetical protein